MLQLQTNYSTINVRWAALQVQLDAYQLSPVTCRFTFPKLHTFSRLVSVFNKWEVRMTAGSLSPISEENSFSSRGKEVKRWVTCPLCDSGKSGDPVKWYHTSKEEEQGGEKEQQRGEGIEWVVLPPPHVVSPAHSNTVSPGQWKVEYLSDILMHK